MNRTVQRELDRWTLSARDLESRLPGPAHYGEGNPLQNPLNLSLLSCIWIKVSAKRGATVSATSPARYAPRRSAGYRS